MNKSKKLILSMGIILVLVVILVTGALLMRNSRSENTNTENNMPNYNNTNKEEEEIVINENYDLARGIEDSIRGTTLQNLEAPIRENNGQIDFSTLPGVTYEFISSITEDNVTEAWIIKMSDKEQYKEIVKKIYERLDYLRNEYKDIEIPNAILNDDDNITILQVNGIVIAVFASDSSAIAYGIKSSINEQEMQNEMLQDDVIEIIEE